MGVPKTKSPGHIEAPKIEAVEIQAASDVLIVQQQGEHASSANSDTERRKLLLAEYKAATNASNKQIYEARNSGVHKPEFYEWLNGKLPSQSTPSKNLERFLTEKKRPIPRKPRT